MKLTVANAYKGLLKYAGYLPVKYGRTRLAPFGRE